jgi:hypothetical protein
MLRIALAALAAAPLAACATIPADPAKELAYCEQMERQMGIDHRHDHAEAKGMGLNPMNVTHDRCRQMLGSS